jgi:Mg-chelatase subunit ChlD
MEYDTSYVTCGSEQLRGIKLRGVQNDERRPTHFILLLDTSGSMEIDNRLTSVKNCVRFMLNFLKPSDRISIIRFSNTAEITVSFQATTVENRMIIERHIDSLVAGGSTNLSAGLLKVRDVAVAASASAMKTGLVILTDGFANMGMNDETSLRNLTGMLREQNPNMSVSTIGYGIDHAANLLRNIALDGGGSYNIISSEEQVSGVFAEVLGGLVSCVAQNVEIVFPSGWSHCTGYMCREENGRKHLFIGDIYSLSEVIVLLKPGGAALDNVQIRGFNCINMTDYNRRLEWAFGVFRDELSYKAYYIRWRLANCLEQIGLGVASGEMRNELDDLEVIIGTLGTGPMINMLRSEILSAKRDLDRPENDENNLNLTQNIQRSAFLTTGRGAATQTVDDPQERSMFLSPIQRQITVELSSQR